MPEANTRHSIVVGIDGSAASRAALSWAVEEARQHGSTVTAVHVWQYPAVAFAGYGSVAIPTLTPEALEKIADDTAATTIAAVVGDDLSVPVVSDIRRGHAPIELVDASEDADLLVIGSEGHGSFRGMLLGSVSMHVVHHARCPVVVVRPGWSPPAR